MMTMNERVNNYLDEHYVGEDMFEIDGTEYEEEEAREIVAEMMCYMDDISSAWYARF